MVARITTPSSLRKTLNYNEKKVQRGTAVCVGENGFLLPLDQLNFYTKLNLFEKRNSLNERAITKTIHVSLNFSNQETHSDEQLNSIAFDYMERLGFGSQPWLIYRHNDAGHPHVHIVSSTIRSNGTRINTHNIGRNQSEIARKAVEEKYGLVKAENQVTERNKSVKPFDLGKLVYGISETKRGITNILNAVVNSYNYTSLPELNAVLKQFNVVADRGNEDGFIFLKRGLTYRVIDACGNKIGVPVKASSINGNPTLSKLDEQFEKNRKHREALKDKLKDKIDLVLLNTPKTISSLAAMLLKENIYTVSRQNAEGKIYGITFVDNANKSVFNGSEIGKGYSVGGLIKQMTNHDPGSSSKQNAQMSLQTNQIAGSRLVEFNGLSPLADLIAPVDEFNPTPYLLKKKKRKRKKMI